MKNKLKNLSIVIVSIFSILTILTTNIINAEGTGSITINTSNSIDMSNKQFDAYKLFDAEYISDNEINYTLNENYKDLFKEILGQESVSSAEARKYVDSLKNNQQDLDNFSKKVVAFSKENNIVPESQTVSQKESVTISNLQYGYYLIADSSDSNTSTAIAKNALVTIDSHDPNKTITLKADAPTIEKTSNDQHAVDHNIGDKVPFKLTSKVPEMDGYDYYKFIVTDTMSKGLSFNSDSVHIKIGDKDITKEVKISNVDGKITMDFGNMLRYKELSGQQITITYDATLTQEAVIGSEGNSNTVKLEYSNDPNQSSQEDNHTTTTPEGPDSTVKVYTFELDVTKTNSSNKVLPGAKFQLKDSNGQVIKFTKSGDTYIVDPNGTVTELVSGENGKIKAKGLDAGKYSLEETQAPDGYNKLEQPIEFTISAIYGGDDNMTLNQLSTDNDAVKGDVNTGIVSTTVVNKTGGLLPETGGRGVIGLVVVGIALMGGASFILYHNRKHKKD